MTPESRPTRSRHTHVPGLDGIRAIAVAAVLLYHARVSGFSGGFLGVDMFFVLSGFLITSLLLGENSATGGIDLRAFWGRRARRLLPAAFVVIAVTLLVVALFYTTLLARMRGDALAAFFYVSNWHEILAHQSYFAAFGRPSPLQHLWSLGVEEQFYILWPLILGLGLRRLGRWGASTVALLFAAGSAVLMAVLFRNGADPTRVYFGTDTHASGLLVGAALAFAWPLGSAIAPHRRGVGIALDVAGVLGLALVVLAITQWHDFDPVVYRGGIALIAIPVAVVLAAVNHPRTRLGRVLGFAPLVWIGARSYGIYLIHWPVMDLSRPGIDVHASRWLVVPAQIVATVVLAAISYRWLERPFRERRALPAIRSRLDRVAPRGRLAIGVVALLAFFAMVGWVAARNIPRPPPPPLARAHSDAAVRRASVQGRPLAVGASVMLAAQPALGRGIVVDAAVGRQPSAIVERLEDYRDDGHLPSRVIVQIGENGPVFGSDMHALERVLRDVPEVLLVNVRVPVSWESEVNGILARSVRSWHQAHIVDWHDASSAPGLLYDDGIHPNPAGQKVYARLVQRALAADR